MAILKGGLEERVHQSTGIGFRDRTFYEYAGAPKPDGVTEKSLAITLPRNAVVRKYEVVMTAAPAHAVFAGQAGQVRTTQVSGGLSVVLDFGTPRTVSAVEAPEGAVIKSVSTWIGTEFAEPKYDEKSGENYVSLPSEVRTERLLLTVSGATTDAIANEMVLVLPESPAGIELRIDGAAPVFSQPSAVDPVSSETLSATSWNSDSQRLVDLAPALSALTGNPLDETVVTFTLTLTSRVPGVLDLQLRPSGQDVLRIKRATFNGQASRDVAFDAEGRQAIALDSLPAAATVHELRTTVTGTVPLVRVLPPLGPDPPDPAFATFFVTPERAACMRLPMDPRLAEVTGVRIPLAAGDRGAEARILLWRSADLVDVSASSPLDNGASEPLQIAAGPEEWRTFSWKKAVPVPKDFVLSAALIVSRGDASFTCADAAAGIGAERLTWGSPVGPWHDLPASLGSARGRIRTIGKPKPDAPFPPLRLELSEGLSAVDVTPNAKGAPVVMSGSPAAQTGLITLVLTSHAATTVTLKDLDVVFTI